MSYGYVKVQMLCTLEEEFGRTECKSFLATVVLEELMNFKILFLWCR